MMRGFLLIVCLMSGSVVDALILEAPYTRMNEAAAVNPPASVRPILLDSSDTRDKF